MSASLQDILNSHKTGRPIIMGVLNVTPDSFSDGGRFLEPSHAIEAARRMIAEGADIIDIGAESTRPGSARVSAAEQTERVGRVLPEVVRLGALVSIDTTSAEVAHFALEAGAGIINDISAGREDAGIFPLAAEHATPLVLMHMRGEPCTMQQSPQYADVAAEVRAFLAEQLAAAEKVGVPRQYCIVDPGIGFGKLLEHNLALLAKVDTLASLGVPVMVGPSRKSFIAKLAGDPPPAERLGGTIAACLAAYRGGATIFRVHDVAPVRQALTVAQAIRNSAAGAR